MDIAGKRHWRGGGEKWGCLTCDFVATLAQHQGALVSQRVSYARYGGSIPSPGSISKRNTAMDKSAAIIAAKTFRKEADALLQRMKEHKTALAKHVSVPVDFEDQGEVIAQHTLAIRDLESCIMRQGMALKYIGNPNPYPNSKDPSNIVVDPTADGLKM